VDWNQRWEKDSDTLGSSLFSLGSYWEFSALSLSWKLFFLFFLARHLSASRSVGIFVFGHILRGATANLIRLFLRLL